MKTISCPYRTQECWTLLDGDQEIAPGVRVKVTGGHSAGHQVVLLEAGSERIAYLGDLIPTPLPPAPAQHRRLRQDAPDETLDEKREILEMAVSGGWLLVFARALTQRAGLRRAAQRQGAAPAGGYIVFNRAD